MPSEDASSQSSFPIPESITGWLEREIADIRKAAELRIKDATKFVRAYVNHEISAAEAQQLLYEYSERWGDALPGVLRSRGLSDEQLMQQIDIARDTGRRFRRPNRFKSATQEKNKA